MTLAEMRKLTIKKQLRIHFTLQNGLACTMDEHGLALIPELKRTADFNLEQELGSAVDFRIVSLKEVDKKGVPQQRNATREELSAMLGSGPTAAGHDEHDDD